MAVNISWNLHRVEPLTSGSTLTRHSLERHHNYAYGKSNPRLRAQLLATLPDPKLEDRLLRKQMLANGQRI